MRYISIENAKPGMKLGKTIFDEMNRILLLENSILSEEYIVRLIARGYPGLYIEDEFSEGIVIDEVIPVELRNKSAEAVKECDIDKLQDIAVDIVESILSNENSISLDVMDLRTYDNYTYKHSVNVAVIASIIAMYLEFDHEEIVDVCLTGLLHDMGKTKIDPDIINKPARLTDEEFDIVRNHSRYSYELLQDNWTICSKVRHGVLHHHENEEGSGYPDKLAGDEIPIYSKIIHVADVYDALTSKRPYKKPFALSEAMEYIMGGGNSLFDINIVNTFVRSVPVYPKGTEIFLSNGEGGIVVSNTSNSLRPVVRLYDSKKEINLNEDKKYMNVTVAPNTVFDRDHT